MAVRQEPFASDGVRKCPITCAHETYYVMFVVSVELLRYVMVVEALFMSRDEI